MPIERIGALVAGLLAVFTAETGRSNQHPLRAIVSPVFVKRGGPHLIRCNWPVENSKVVWLGRDLGLWLLSPKGLKGDWFSDESRLSSCENRVDDDVEKKT